MKAWRLILDMKRKAWGLPCALLLLFAQPSVLLADVASKTSVDATSIAGTNWTNIPNIQGDDGAYCDYLGQQDYLTMKTFGFAIPLGAVIDGVEVIVNGQGTDSRNARRKWNVGLTKNGATVAGTLDTSPAFLDSVDSDITSGSPTSLWGTTLSRTDINSANFGIMIKDNNNGAHTLRFDHVVVKVYYTPPAEVTLTPTDVAPASSDQGTEFAVERFSMATDQTTAEWTWIKVTKTGTLADGDVTDISIYLDDGDLGYDAGDTLISGGADTFTSGISNITLTAAQALTTSAQNYFIVYDLEPLANPGDTIGASIGNVGDLSITSPDTMATTNIPANSSNVTVNDIADTITVVDTDQAPGSIAQNSDFALTRLSMTTDVEEAVWSAVTVTKTGTLADSFITSVKIYLDDGDLTYDAGDTLVSPAVTTFSGGSASITLSAAQTITTSAKVYFVVYDLESDATVAATVGAEITANTDLTVTSPDLISAVGFAINSTNASITDVADTVTLTGTDLAPTNIVQGSDYAVEKLSMTTNDDAATWTAMTITKTGNLVDGDVSAVKIYLDTGNGSYGAEDTLITSGSDVFSSGSSAITLSASQTLTPTPKVYFIVYTLAALANPGDTIGAEVTVNTDMTVSGADTVSTSNFPFNSTNSNVLLKAEEVTVTFTDQAPANTDQGDENSMLRMSMVTDAATAEWTAINVSKTGTMPDAGITSVKIYLDDGDNSYDAGDTLISPAVTTFSGGAAAITLSAAQTLTTSAKVYFIVYDLEPDAQAAATIGAEVTSNSQLTVTNPDTVATTNFPGNSTNITVDDVIDTITMTDTDLAPGNIAQDSDYAPLRFSLVADQDEAIMTNVRVTKSGTIVDGDIDAVKIYLDDGDNSYDAGDTLITSGGDTFSGGPLNISLTASQTIGTSAKTYFVVYTLNLLANVGDTVGARVVATTDLTITGSVDVVAGTNFPADSTNSTVIDGVDTVTVTPADLAPANVNQDVEYAVESLSMATDQEDATWTAITVTKLGTLSDAGVTSVKIYLDDGDLGYDAGDTLISPAITAFSGGAAAITLSAAQTLTTTAKLYFIVYDLSPEALAGTNVGARVTNATDITLTTPDAVATGAFPVSSSVSTILEVPDTVTVTITDLAPTYAFPTQDAAFFKLSMVTDADSAEFTAIDFEKLGSLTTGRIENMRLYEDDGDGIFDSGVDTILDSDLFDASPKTLTLTTAETITTTPKVYFMVFEPKFNAQLGRTTGIQMDANTRVTITAPDTISTSGFPANSSLATIASPPAVVVVTPTDDAPGTIAQSSDYAVEKLSLATGGNPANWTDLKVTKTGTLADSGVSAISLYLDGGDGNYDVGDTLITSGADTFTAGVSNINIPVSEALSSVAKVYFIVYTLTATAGVGDTIGAEVTVKTDFTHIAPDVTDNANFPINSTNSTVTDVADTMTLTETDTAPGSIVQAGDFELQRLSLATAVDEADWTAVTVTKSGTLADGSVGAVKIYLDGGNSVYDVGDTLISTGLDVFTSGTVAITLSAAQTITTSAKEYFIVYNLDSEAPVGDTIGASIAVVGDLTVSAPDLITDNLPANSSNASITDLADTVTVAKTDLAPGTIVQGASYAVEKLSMTTNEDFATWTDITVTKTGTAADGDVTAIKIYLDTGNGTYGAEDTLITSGSDVFSSGTSAISLSASQSLSATPKVYFIVYDLSFTAVVSDTIGAEVTNNTDLTLTGVDVVSATGFPINSSNTSILLRGDELTITPTDLVGGTIAQDSDFAALRLSMVMDFNSAQWTAINVSKTGTLADAGVTSVKIYLDDGDNGYDAGDTLISPAVTAFSGGAAAITLTAAQTLNTSAKVYFVVLDLESDATVGNTIGASIASLSEVTVTVPDVVLGTNLPANSSNATITDIADTVTFTSTNEAPANIAQDSDYAVEKFSVATNEDEATWTAMTVTKTGTLIDGEIDAVKIYLDDGDNSYDAGDTIVTSGADTFTSGTSAITLSAAQTITPTPKVYFLVYDLDQYATIGNTVGGSIALVGDVTVTAIDTKTDNFPANSTISSVIDAIDTVTQTPTDQAPGSVAQSANVSLLRLSMLTDGETATWTDIKVTKSGTVTDAGIAAVDIYLDDGDNTYDGGDTLITSGSDVFASGVSNITLSAAQTLTTSAKVYFVVYTLTDSAGVGSTVGASVATQTDLTFTTPDATAATNFPANSTNATITDVADTITVTGTDISPGAISQGSDYAPLKLSMVTDQDQATWTALTITKSGNLADGQVDAIKIYLDDGDGTYNSGSDTLVTGGADTFTGGTSAITLSASQTITTTPKVYFVVYVLNVAATIGNTIGGSAAVVGDMTVTAPDLKTNNFPHASSNATVAVPDVMTVTPTDLAPATIGQGANYPVLKLSLVTNANSAGLTDLNVYRTGTLARAEVISIHLYQDDGNGVYGPEDTELDSGFFDGADQAALSLSPTPTITTVATEYFVVYVLDSAANIGDTIGANIAAAGDFTLVAPDTVAGTNIPINSSLSTIAAQEIGVSLSVTLIDAGSVDVNTNYVIPLSVTVTNIGNIQQTYDLRGAQSTPGTPWGIASTSGVDQFSLQAGVSGSEPALGDFGSEDIVLNSGGDLCTSSVYAINSLRCDKQTVGGDTVFWFRINMPTISSVETQQEMTVTISANAP